MQDQGPLRLRAALVALLLFAQGMAMVHDIDHIARADTGSCIVCPLHGNLQHAVSGATWIEPIRRAHQAPGATAALSPAKLNTRTALARAPPSYA